jgi:hypothetical protein
MVLSVVVGDIVNIITFMSEYPPAKAVTTPTKIIQLNSILLFVVTLGKKRLAVKYARIGLC